MPACATTSIIAEYPTIGNLFLPVPDTDLSDFLAEVAELSRFAPEIITAIDHDLDVHAREKKMLRLADRRFYESQTGDFPKMDVEAGALQSEHLTLAVGRPRLPGEAVFMFLMLRGFLGSLSTKQSRWILHESMSVYAWLQSRGLQMPGISTILDNLNVVSHATQKLIFDRQIAKLLGQGLEDFRTLTLDSTSVKANSSWPTDARILTGLLERVNRLGQQLNAFGLENFRQGWVPRWLEEMDKLEFQICLVAGKANSKIKLKQQYRQLLRRGKSALAALETQFERVEKALQPDTLAPSRRAILLRITDDGYASAQGRDALHEMGVAKVSISGAKGKRLTALEDWESEIYRDARRCRSAVESLMFTIKNGFTFGELGRRGIEAVRDELLEKVLAYNCCRSILIQERKRENLEQAA